MWSTRYAQQLHTQPRARLTHAYHCAGFGKTTLAHIAARHCGYTPVEINASDDRSGGTLLRRVENAMEMRSVFGSRKPNLGKVEVLAHTVATWACRKGLTLTARLASSVILDEIDGAMASGEGGLAKLVKMISETGKQRYIKQKMVRCLHYHRHHLRACVWCLLTH